MPRISRRGLLQGAAALGTLGRSGAASAQEMTPEDVVLEGQGARTPMRPYIGAATSRIDGRAKVTGAAKYAGEFNVPNLVYGFVVESTIAKGRIVRIDTRDALQVKGVVDVLTHQNRPPLADADKAWKDDVAPEKGSPFRPLYDDKILFSRQPVALVLAEDWDTARFAASRVKVEYEEEPSVTDLEAQRDTAFVVEKPEKPRGDAASAIAAADVRHEAEYFIPTEHHNPMELYATTAVWDADGKLTVYDKTQGVQNVQRYLCDVFNKKSGRCARHVAVHGRRFRLRSATAVSGGVGGARRRGAATAGSPRPHASANVQLGLSSGDDRAPGARGQGGWDARRHDARGDLGDLPVRRILAQRHRMGRPSIQVPQHEVRTQARASRCPHLGRHARARRGDGRLRARMRDGRTRGGTQSRSA